jgi:TetR/AcrR family transcriptional repressor of lmrAB and yxaGH operons
LNEIVHKAKAPKGSIYYHFPGGKEQIAAEAIALSGRTLAERLRINWVQKQSAAAAIEAFINRLTLLLGTSRFDSSGLLSIIASETATTNKRLNQCCQEAFTRLIEIHREKLADCGVNEIEAERLSTVVTAAILGGVILSRTFHSRKPLQTIAMLFGKMLQAADPTTKQPPRSRVGEMKTTTGKRATSRGPQ